MQTKIEIDANLQIELAQVVCFTVLCGPVRDSFGNSLQGNIKYFETKIHSRGRNYENNWVIVVDWGYSYSNEWFTIHVCYDQSFSVLSQFRKGRIHYVTWLSSIIAHNKIMYIPISINLIFVTSVMAADMVAIDSSALKRRLGSAGYVSEPVVEVTPIPTKKPTTKKPTKKPSPAPTFYNPTLNPTTSPIVKG